MKSKFLIVLLAVVVCFSFALSACNKGNPEVTDSNSESSSSQHEELNVAVVDRSQYNSENLLSELKNYQFASNSVRFEDYVLSVTEEYKVGDVFNMLLDNYDNNLGISTDFKKGFGFSLYEDGYWRTNFDKKKAHRLINGILDLNLDGKSKIQVSQQDLDTYNNTKLYTLLGYSQSVKDTVASINPSLDALLNTSYGEIYGFVSGDRVAQESVLKKIYLKDIMPLIGVEITDKTLTVYQAVFVEKLPNGMTVYEFMNLSDDERKVASQEMAVQAIFDVVCYLDEYMGSDLMAQGKNWEVCFAYINRLLSSSKEEQQLLFCDIESYINAQTFGAISDLTIEILNNNTEKLDELFLSNGMDITCEQIKQAVSGQFFVEYKDVVIGDYCSSTTLNVALSELGFDASEYSSQTIDEILFNFGEVKLAEFKNLNAEQKAKLNELMQKLTLNDLIKG